MHNSILCYWVKYVPSFYCFVSTYIQCDRFPLHIFNICFGGTHFEVCYSPYEVMKSSWMSFYSSIHNLLSCLNAQEPKHEIGLTSNLNMLTPHHMLDSLKIWLFFILTYELQIIECVLHEVFIEFTVSFLVRYFVEWYSIIHTTMQ